MPKNTAPDPDANATPAEKKKRLLELTGAFCETHLNTEYKRLCKKAIDKLSKMKPPPYERGRLDIWAAGIVHALGSNNFLFDPGFEPYMSAADIAANFGTSPSSTANKAASVRDLLDLSQLNMEFLTKDLQQELAAPLEQLTGIESLLSVFGGGATNKRRSADSFDRGKFIAADSPAQSRFYELAEQYGQRGASGAVENALRQMIAQDPDFYDSYLMLRDLLQKKGRRAEGEQLLETAYQRALARVTAKNGRWPTTMEWGWLENRHIIRTFLNKALADWTAGKTEQALVLLRALLHSNPGDNIGARDYILAIRMGMTFEGFEKKFLSQYGYDGMKMIEWFDSNVGRFPEEFDWWKKAVDYES